MNQADTLLGSLMYYIGHFKKNVIGETSVSRVDIVLLGGVLGSLFSLLQSLVAPLIGRLSDKYGRRKVLLITTLGNALSCLVWVFAHDFKTFVLFRVVGGLCEGNVQLSNAIISDITTPETRSKGLALIGVAFAIAFTFGPATGAFFASKDLSALYPDIAAWGLHPYSYAAFISLALVVVEIVYLYFFLEETIHYRKHQEPPETSAQSNNTKRDQMIRQKIRSLGFLNWIHLGFIFIFSGMEYTITFLTFDIFDFNNMQQGKLLGFIGILSALLQGGYVRRMAYKVGEKRIVIQGVAGCALGLGSIAFFAIGRRSMPWLYVGAAFLAFTSATVVNCLTALVSLHCDQELNDQLARGHVLGTFRAYGQIGRAAGPVAASTFYWIFGSTHCYGFGCITMVIITMVISHYVQQPKPEEKEN
ncbi:MFS general substrate transporter [Basidiobolus meristosporus CBS 931.73]|uniref:MFS general substrate transporter n=1 Tax=Basidiobolus meristosporus CBS 931.73 TaxID=1314790 RepID=A0A1Y1XJV1_9FUNG|nr:MFS general substrate transporter [Basidiobolus meristosporus CBS 931.73]|eukprot:ORX86020.1 MFS general substrate transporter [Basidiobolus meristosporus CBS 931.73]